MTIEQHFLDLKNERAPLSTAVKGLNICVLRRGRLASCRVGCFAPATEREAMMPLEPGDAREGTHYTAPREGRELFRVR